MFGEVDSFVCNIHFSLFILQSNVCHVYFFVRCTLFIYLFIYLLYVFFVRTYNYLFVFLNYLFAKSKINYLVLEKIFLKIFCKYRQVWSYFEDLVIIKIMV